MMKTYNKSGQAEPHFAAEIIATVSISEVYRALGGAELRHGRGVAFWRNGAGRNVSLNDAKGAWWDFVVNEGGGVLDLVQKVRGCSRAGALGWVADLFGLTLPRRSVQESRKAAAQWERARQLATQCELWSSAKIRSLETHKARACAEEDLTALGHHARELFALENHSQEQVFATFMAELRRDPEGTGAWIREGQMNRREDLLLAGCGLAAVAPELPLSVIRHAIDTVVREDVESEVTHAS